MLFQGRRIRPGAPTARSPRLARTLCSAIALLFVSCAIPTEPVFKDGVLVTFDVNGERYSIFITNPETIEQVIALWNRQSSATIPSGRVVKGGVPYNEPWSWHIDSEDITMAENTIELCDGVPSYVEAHLDEWIADVGYFCPWSAELVALEDYR
jgi:hypothetical protein